SVIKKFDLARHYNLSPGDKYYATYLIGTYNQNVKISKTQYESIEVSVTDLDPVLAKNMVNAILFYTDKKIAKVHYSKYNEVVESVYKTMQTKKAEIDSIKRLYHEISTTYGIYDMGGQSQEITRGELRTVDGRGDNINTKDVIKLKSGMVEKGGDLIFLSNRISNLGNEYSELARRYDLARFDLDKKFTFVNMVTPPMVSDKKSYPRKLFVMLAFVAGTLLFSLFSIVVIEQRPMLSAGTNN
ncbi:MAG TPA: hypothetical protein PKN21_11710, partial [Bacteroidales bacterium]|nr:hypothetical protein [Bacteroidales bacterium]